MPHRGSMLHVRYGGLRVFYHSGLDGGGMGFGQLYRAYLSERVGLAKVGHLFEFGAGPGFIGFSLLAHGVCDRLTLADVNPEAVAACRRTIAENGLEDRVRVYQSDGLDGVPVDERWDLVVSNPPHFAGTGAPWEADLRLVDPGLAVHRKLYGNVARHLAPGGKVILQENGLATRASDFEEMIRRHGLRVVDVHPAPDPMSARWHALRSRAVLLGELLLNRPTVEAIFKRGPWFRRQRESPRRSLWPFYFIWSEPA